MAGASDFSGWYDHSEEIKFGDSKYGKILFEE